MLIWKKNGFFFITSVNTIHTVFLMMFKQSKRLNKFIFVELYLISRMHQSLFFLEFQATIKISGILKKMRRWSMKKIMKTKGRTRHLCKSLCAELCTLIITTSQSENNLPLFPTT